MKKTALFSSIAALLASCASPPPQAYFNRGTPESLLDMSSEVVNVSLDDSASVDELASWINKEQPSRAELLCADKAGACEKAKSVLEQFNVPYERKAPPSGTARVALHYERVVARDCENRYVDNTLNQANLNHPTFGCSIAANIVQHVTDKRQFVNPSLLDYPDAENAAGVYRSYEETAHQPESATSGANSGSLLSGLSTGSSR